MNRFWNPLLLLFLPIFITTAPAPVTISSSGSSKVIPEFTLSDPPPAPPALSMIDPSRSVDSNIREVTVYRQGAQIRRRATIQLDPGRNEILFTGLASSLQPESIQLSGDERFLIVSLSHRTNYLAEHPRQVELQELTSLRDSLTDRIEQEKITEQILQRELDILLANKSLKGTQQNLSAEELRSAMDYFHQKLVSLENRKLEIKRTLKKLETELKKINQQISSLSDSRAHTVSEITAVLDSERTQQATLQLSYLVNNAGWYPSYDLRIGDIEEPAGLSYKANIQQSTGIEWENVKLTVTSAMPERGGRVPELNPWYLNFYTPPTSSADLVPAMSREKSNVPQSEREQLSEAVRTMPVQFVRNQTSFSYRIDRPYSIPSGGGPLTVGIEHRELPATYRYVSAPKLRPQAYLTARIGDWNRYNLLRGESNLFFENTYVGRSVIDPNTVSDTLSFSLGNDESIVVERNKLREYQEKNFFGNRVRESFVWEISVRNTKNKEILIEVLDQIPVSRNEDIEVSLKERSGARYDGKTGELIWQLQLGPGENRNVRFAYEVEYPKGRTLRID